MTSTEERWAAKAKDAEQNLYDLIPRFKGAHGRYLAERDFYSLRNLAMMAENVKRDCIDIMRTFRGPDVEEEIRKLENYD